MIGLFAGSEFLTQAMNLDRQQVRAALDAVKLPTAADFKKVWKTILRSCGIGTLIGVLPAEGGTVAGLIGYNEAKRWSKTPEKVRHRRDRGYRRSGGRQQCRDGCRHGAHPGPWYSG
ncbi:MAG: tripartite tricarboxylate transporter permease [Geminicoccaceae bacterium]